MTAGAIDARSTALRPYDAYKDSGVGWLPKIPKSWSMLRNGQLFAQRNETGSPDLPVLEVSLHTGVRVRNLDEGTRKQIMSDRAKYKVAHAGDLAYNMMRMWQGAVGVVPVDGLVSPAYVVARPWDRSSSSYFNLVFRTPEYMREVEVFSRGIVPDRNRLYWEAFKQIRTPVPPLDERAAIIRYLNDLDARIRRYLAAKRKLMALLNEQKQAIIHEAITAGLDPEVRRKHSGVNGWGDVPEQWHVVPLTAVAKVKSVRGEVDRQLLSVYLDRGVILFSEVDEKRTNVTSEDLSKYQAVDPGDFVLNNQQAWRGSVGVSKHRGIVSPAYLVLLLEPILESAYANLLFRSRVMIDQYAICSRGVGSIQRNLYWPHLKRAITVFPPFPEQVAIVDIVDHATAKLTAAVEATRRQVELVRELRDRLVAEVATGKLDVREAAAYLPIDDAAIGEPIGDFEENRDDATPAEEEEALA